MRNLIRALSGRAPAGRHRRTSVIRGGMKVFSSVAAAALVVTGLTLPAVASAQEAPLEPSSSVGALLEEAPEATPAPMPDLTPAPEASAPEAPAPEASAPEASASEAPVVNADVVPVAPRAAGDLATTIEWVDFASNVPIDDLTASFASRTDADLALVSLLVGYSCGPAACGGTSVHVAPMPLDPYYGTRTFATLDRRSLPTGATISGNAATGYTVVLGDLAPGTSGSFTLTYNFQSRPVGTSPQSFFPEGYVVPASSVISASGIEDYSASDEVTWHIETPTPRVLIGDSGVARADQDYTYTLFMSSSCQFDRATAGHGEPTYECAETHTTTQTLPAGAVFVSTTHGGVYDAAARTVTWTTAGAAAAPGWGPLNNLGEPRNTVVRFPASIVTDPISCVIDVSSELGVGVTYLSGAQGSASSTFTHTVNACQPFSNATLEKSVSRDAGTAAAPIVWAGQNHYWNVRVANRSNAPGVTTITETLDQPGFRVYSITGPVAQATVTLDDGTVANAAGPYSAPTGRRIVAATVVTVPLAGPNTVESDQSLVNLQNIRFNFTVESDVPIEGYTRSNTASAVMSFPGTPELAPLDLGAKTQDVQVLRRPAYLSPSIGSSVAGGSTILPGEVATFTMNGSSANVEPGVPFEPQYVFVAPAGWDIVADSAAIAGLDDASFEYRTVVINGESRQSVLAQRPAGTVWGTNATWPAMVVKATPTATVTAGALSTAQFFQGDARHNFGPTTAIWGNNGNFRYQDAADLDGDGDVTESFAFVNTNVRIGATTAINVLKEICQPDSSQADGCLWLSNPDAPVSVAPNTTGITYRVTVSNLGSAALNNVVAYDVLPHPGDTGTSQFSAGTPRGSTFTEQVKNATAGAAASLTFSDSTNPCRAEVYPGAPGCVNDWNGTAAGAQAIRMAVDGALASGASVSFTYAADVIGAPTAGAIACNSVAVDSATTPPTEPRAVCAAVQEADLEVTAPASVDAQIGRPTVFPFEFANLGGTTESAASVTIDVPAGVTVTNLAPSGWSCTAPSTAPVEGPAAINCAPASLLTVGTAVGLDLAAIVTAEDVAVTATVTGPMYDRDPDSNTATITASAVAAAGDLEVTKADGVEAVLPGDESIYTITVRNPLAFETIDDVTVSDTLPAGTEFVSASDGGVFADGVVTWTLASVEAASAEEVTVTIRVTDAAANQITNTVTAAATDPAFPDEALEGSATDVDDVDRITLTKTAALDDASAPRPGDLVTYTFVATNTGGGALSEVAIADPMVGLSAITIESWPAQPGRLAPGQSVTGTATYELTAADVDTGTLANTASVTGLSADGGTATATASQTVTLPAVPGISIDKTASESAEAAGDTITFTLVVTNTGNVTLSDVSLVDLMPGLSDLEVEWNGAVGVLAAGESVTATADYVLVQADVDRGSVDNIATVSGVPVRGEPVDAEDEIVVAVPALPALVIVKTADLLDGNHDGLANPGEKIVYAFEVTNSGNVTMHDVVVNDAKVTGIPAIATLAPGETVTVRAAEYTVTAAEGEAGDVVNTATASGLTPDAAAIVSPESTITVKAAVIPGARSGDLASTGFDGSGMAVLSGAMLVLGVGMFLAVARRRRGARGHCS